MMKFVKEIQSLCVIQSFVTEVDTEATRYTNEHPRKEVFVYDGESN